MMTVSPWGTTMGSLQPPSPGHHRINLSSEKWTNTFQGHFNIFFFTGWNVPGECQAASIRRKTWREGRQQQEGWHKHASDRNTSYKCLISPLPSEPTALDPSQRIYWQIKGTCPANQKENILLLWIMEKIIKNESQNGFLRSRSI